MNGDKNFEINYWGEDYKSIHFKPQTSKRSIKKKLAIVSSFVSILAIIPFIIFGLSSMQISNSEKLTSAKIESAEITSPLQDKKITPKTTEAGFVEIIKNDSYWKISKRVCGTGKFYLSIMEENESKALFEGETAKATCSL